MSRKDYAHGQDMYNFERIDSISCYGYNYHIGINNDLLLGISDDEDLTEWYLVEDRKFIYIGDSRVSDDDILIRNELTL